MGPLWHPLEFAPERVSEEATTREHSHLSPVTREPSQHEASRKAPGRSRDAALSIPFSRRLQSLISTKVFLDARESFVWQLCGEGVWSAGRGHSGDTRIPLCPPAFIIYTLLRLFSLVWLMWCLPMSDDRLNANTWKIQCAHRAQGNVDLLPCTWCTFIFHCRLQADFVRHFKKDESTSRLEMWLNL